MVNSFGRKEKNLKLGDLRDNQTVLAGYYF